MGLMKNRIIRILLIAAGIIVLLWLMIGESGGGTENAISYSVKKGEFKSIVYSTGQLEAEKSVSIDVPSELSSRQIRIYEIKISQLVDEGTVVDSGGFVASLDHSAVEELLTQNKDDLETQLRSYEDAKIDTNINLSNLRDGLINSKVSLEEKKLILNQSMYESPAVKRQAALDLERAERQLEQDLRNYELKKKQDKFKVQRAYEQVQRQQETVNDIEKLFDALEVKAPQPGMVIYSTDRMGNKIKVGSTVSRWDPQIAMLPDLTSMISKTYINEIDISKVKVGQPVKVGIDAFPDKLFDGKVTDVANIGQVLPGGDAKVFEVIIQVIGTDKDLRPAMTTSNTITTDVLKEVLFIPLETLFKNDSLLYVITERKGNLTRQIVDLGATNENYAVVLNGLSEGDVLLMTEPENASELRFEGLEIYESQKQKKLEQERIKKEALADTTKQIIKNDFMDRNESNKTSVRPGRMRR